MLNTEKGDTMTEVKISKNEAKNIIAKNEAKLSKLQAEWQSLLDINKNGIKLNEKQAKRLMKIKKECSTLALAISVGKEILEEETYA
tara:strand:+ start:572 stop:832 length:261 start_codon:yes stop_codon:yes gene_type:complete